jgi:hypothetical protein
VIATLFAPSVPQIDNAMPSPLASLSPASRVNRMLAPTTIQVKTSAGSHLRTVVRTGTAVFSPRPGALVISGPRPAALARDAGAAESPRSSS